MHRLDAVRLLRVVEAAVTAKATVHEALRRYRNLCRSLRYGGLNDQYKLAQRALEELDNLIEVEQPQLMGGDREKTSELGR